MECLINTLDPPYSVDRRILIILLFLFLRFFAVFVVVAHGNKTRDILVRGNIRFLLDYSRASAGVSSFSPVVWAGRITALKYAPTVPTLSHLSFSENTLQFSLISAQKNFSLYIFPVQLRTWRKQTQSVRPLYIFNTDRG